MKQKSKLLCIMFLCSLYIASLKGQETISTSGGNATGSGGSVSYTVGQITNSSLSGTNGSVAQGVQQPYEISVATAIENARDITLECSIYPNPASGFIMLKVKNYDFKKLNYRLYDINGILLQSKKVEGDQTQIQMESLKPGTYFLIVSDSDKDLKTFKIIKN